MQKTNKPRLLMMQSDVRGQCDLLFWCTEPHLLFLVQSCCSCLTPDGSEDGSRATGGRI